MFDLPNDLKEFLRMEGQLQYDVKRSRIGDIRLKKREDVALSTIEVRPDDTVGGVEGYASLEGAYHVPVFDLIERSHQFSVVGTLGWLPSVESFGVIDFEKTEVIIFPGITWQNIVQDPIKYLDVLWRVPVHDWAKSILPWLYFPLHLDARDDVIEPYPRICQKHRMPVVARKAIGHRLTWLLRNYHLDSWLESRDKFPCCGVTGAEGGLLHCSPCFEAEQQWVKYVYAWLPVRDAAANRVGYVVCPGCGRSFSYRSDIYLDQVHLRCGQRVNVIVPDKS